MNINEIIQKVFKDFKYDGELIPISPNIYTGDATIYLVYYTYSTIPEGFADDQPIVESTFGTLDIYSNKNYKKLKNEVKRKLVKECGFTWTGDGLEDYEEDTKLWHCPINFMVSDEVTFLNEKF